MSRFARFMDWLARQWRNLIAGTFWSSQSNSPETLLPDGFEIHRLADSGIYVVDNFCTPEEAAEVVEAARSRLLRSGIVSADGKIEASDYRQSETAELYGMKYQHSAVIPLMRRAGALVGLPYTHLENVFVTRYDEGGRYGQHIDFGDVYSVDRLYTVLLYLNSMPEEQGGATVFPSLRAAVQPKVGRAVSWVNKNPDGSGHMETNHAAYPVKNGGEKWVIQFWFRRYRMSPPLAAANRIQSAAPLPLTAADPLPQGVRCTESGSRS